MRIKEMEQKIKDLFGISVEFCEPYMGQYGTKDYVGEIFFLHDARDENDIQNKKRDLVDLVKIANKLDIKINQDGSNTGIICRNTEGIRATNQILFKDKDTLDKFKKEINFLSPQKTQVSDSALRQNSVYPTSTQVSLKKNEENEKKEKPFFDYKKIFG